jgi:hypothetical protein
MFISFEVQTLVRTDVSDKHIAFTIGVTKIGKIGMTMAVTSKRNTVQINIILYLDGYYSHSAQHALIASYCQRCS